MDINVNYMYGEIGSQQVDILSLKLLVLVHIRNVANLWLNLRFLSSGLCNLLKLMVKPLGLVKVYFGKTCAIGPF